MRDTIDLTFDSTLNALIVRMPGLVTLDDLRMFEQRLGPALLSHWENAALAMLLDSGRHAFESVDCLKRLREVLSGMTVTECVSRTAFVSLPKRRPQQVVSYAEAYFHRFEDAYNWLSTRALPTPPRVIDGARVRLALDTLTPGDVTKGFVPGYHFHIHSQAGNEVGHLNFRVGNTRHSVRYAGHIGFEIKSAYRGNGLALQACRTIAPFVASVCNAVFITANPDNLPSIRTIERLGAAFVDVCVIQPDDPVKTSSSCTKMRYLWRPGGAGTAR